MQCRCLLMGINCEKPLPHLFFSLWAPHLPTVSSVFACLYPHPLWQPLLGKLRSSSVKSVWTRGATGPHTPGLMERGSMLNMNLALSFCTFCLFSLFKLTFIGYLLCARNYFRCFPWNSSSRVSSRLPKPQVVFLNEVRAKEGWETQIARTICSGHDLTLCACLSHGPTLHWTLEANTRSHPRCLLPPSLYPIYSYFLKASPSLASLS